MDKEFYTAPEIEAINLAAEAAFLVGGSGTGEDWKTHEDSI